MDDKTYTLFANTLNINLYCRTANDDYIANVILNNAILIGSNTYIPRLVFGCKVYSNEERAISSVELSLPIPTIKWFIKNRIDITNAVKSIEEYVFDVIDYEFRRFPRKLTKVKLVELNPEFEFQED